MSYFDSPIARCEAIHQMVLTDETCRECALEHRCPPDRVCPLKAYFTDHTGVVDHEEEAAVAALTH